MAILGRRVVSELLLDMTFPLPLIGSILRRHERRQPHNEQDLKEEVFKGRVRR